MYKVPLGKFKQTKKFKRPFPLYHGIKDDTVINNPPSKINNYG